MKAKSIHHIIFFVILMQSLNAQAWDSAAAKYYPLSVGNVYLYHKNELRLGCYPVNFQGKSRIEITGFVNKPNGKNYFKFSGWWNDNNLRANPFLNYQRIDSGTMNVYAYDSLTNSEFLIDSLLARVNDRFNCNRLTSVSPNGSYFSGSNINFLGRQRTIKIFSCSGPALVSYFYELAEDIGFSKITSCELGGGQGYFLTGCVINGIAYGDTSFIRVSDYFPLKVGNVWSYDWIHNGNPSGGGRFNVYVTRDTLNLMYGRTYYLCNFPNLSQWLRFDSLSGNIYAYAPGGGCSYHPNEILVDSLYSLETDTAKTCGFTGRKCIETGTVQLFGNSFSKKNFNPLFVLTASSRFYAKGIGLYYINEGDPFTTDYTLRGSYINGVLYGDTTLTKVHQLNNTIPERFSLEQNYPNPFNPKTVIVYSLTGNRNVSLKVFDVFGKELITLVNEKQNAGSYAVDFNGEGFPSGVYFYRLKAGEFEETKRMILLK